MIMKTKEYVCLRKKCILDVERELYLVVIIRSNSNIFERLYRFTGKRKKSN